MVTLSRILWSIWLGEFLVLELPAALKLVPWMTLSGTSFDAQQEFPILTRLLFGFLLGLCIHITFLIAGHHVPFWRAILFGLLVGYSAHLVLHVSE